MSASRSVPLLVLVMGLLLTSGRAGAGHVDSPAAAAPPAPVVHRLVLPGLAVEPSRHVTLAAVGDVMLARSVGDQILANGPAFPFAGVRSAFEGADLVSANLECTISDRGDPAAKGFTFRTPPAAADALVSGGINVVSMANNHAFDFGPDAVADTEASLDARDIAHAGAGANAGEARSPAIVTRNGLRVAFLSYADVPVEWNGFDTRSWEAGPDSPGIAWLTIDHVRQDVAAARKSADLVVVFMHFGYEGSTVPSERQQDEARAAIDAGASLVVGHHPHVLQPAERYGGGLIVYSMGNFVFDGFDNPTDQSAILFVELSDAGAGAYRFVPVTIDGHGFPRAG